MISPEIEKIILEGLNRLPFEKQKQVQEYVQALVISAPPKKDKDLIKKAFGSLKGSRFTSERYMQLKKEEKDLEL
ncbi:MAG: hypothetical protein GY754_20745 [bacterium]|nr:hypothetical protein [bacterium]